MAQAVKDIPAIDFSEFRKDFPVLHQEVNGKPLVYLDNAASSQMPESVAQRINDYHRNEHANVHRGIHTLSQKATDAFEETRKKVRDFINADSENEIVYTTGTTDSINLVANSYGLSVLKEGDEIILSEMEHHANIVPWQMIAERTGAVIKVIPVTDSGDLDMQAYESLLGERTKIVAVVHVSNALGTVNPVKEITALAHEHDAVVLIDGAQSVPHQPIDVQDIDCDFFAFSAHKMCGPTGFGILYGKMNLLEEMPPYRGGGDMIDKVSFEETTYNVPPFRFEAGTPPIAACIGLGSAIDYLNHIGMDRIANREQELVNHAVSELNKIEGLRFIGNSDRRASVCSFVIDGIHATDIGTILDKQGIAVRTGHHCAQPILRRYNVPSTARASISFYNNEDDIDRLIDGIRYAKSFFE
ncbi:cysteine desulfurase [Rhodohalobacter barkolensis]|uniref:Cysteine desulfurase n=1 Tax=Rhodohalobacter barkolensis TaxID=2053187 RepID=A0A2N0VKS7_9BACT|nr:cysteine desulfurase [Rhodohalobacter barkolensis]PKD44782.1 cysteine desulfurase CsdA [Rhodohalobacter barkolensis]